MLQADCSKQKGLLLPETGINVFILRKSVVHSHVELFQPHGLQQARFHCLPEFAQAHVH